jgi:hypothetical protein
MTMTIEDSLTNLLLEIGRHLNGMVFSLFLKNYIFNILKTH